MNFWDQAFDAPGYQYGTEPNAFLRAQAHRLHVGSSVLVPGDGEGRNGVSLAHQGHAVLSVDSSAVGLRKAGELDEGPGHHGRAHVVRWLGQAPMQPPAHHHPLPESTP